MSGLRSKPMTPRQIAMGCAPDVEWERPDLQEHFVIEEGSPDAEEEEDGPAPLSREARKFIKKHQRRESRLRAKGRIA